MSGRLGRSELGRLDTPAANSALWAAYGDALGWISELTDERGLRRRTEGRGLHDLQSWRRRIGGRSGVELELKPGTYSDDTQLRLAVGRACGPLGFDVEAFSRVELSVWPSYALGGGIGTKAAAAAMARPNARWSANFVDNYVNGGGNGAAMRVQPHAWVPKRPTTELLYDIARDAVVTHGHPRGILGAALHAVTLADLMPDNPQQLAALGERSWLDFVARLHELPIVMGHDPELSAFWIPAWEDLAGSSFEQAMKFSIDELAEDLMTAREALDSRVEVGDAYRAVLDALDLRRDSHRGSGTRTVVAALSLLTLWRRFDRNPQDMMVLAVNELGTDTDSIASMFGSYVGALTDRRPPSPPLDWELIAAEANRIASGEPSHHSYPDLLTWDPPKTQGDALVGTESSLFVLGLGKVQQASEVHWNSRRDFGWVEVQTEFGQTLVIKRRAELPEYGAISGLHAVKREEQAPRTTSPTSTPVIDDAGDVALFPSTSVRPSAAEALDQSIRRVRDKRFASMVIGDCIKSLTADYGPATAAAFGALVADILAEDRR